MFCGLACIFAHFPAPFGVEQQVRNCCGESGTQAPDQEIAAIPQFQASAPHRRADHRPATSHRLHDGGTPSIGFNTGGIPEMIAHKQNGYVAQKMDSNDLATGIDWLLENLAIASIEGRKFVENNYSEDIVSQKHIDFYLKSIQDVSQN